MATVPATFGGQRAQSRQNVIEVGDTRGAFGDTDTGLKQAIGVINAAGDVANVSASLKAADDRIKDREDALSRAKALNEAKKKAAEAIEKGRKANGGIGNTDNVAAVQSQVSDIYSSAAQNYSPRRSQNALVFQTELEKQRGEVTRGLNAASIDQGRADMNVLAREKLNEVALTLNENPGSLDDARQEYAEWMVANYAPAMQESDQIAMWQLAEGRFAQTNLDFMMDVANSTGDFKDVRKMLADPVTAKALDPDGSGTVARGYRMRVWKAEGEVGKLDREIGSRLRMLKALDPSLSKDQMARARASLISGVDFGLEAPAGRKTTADELGDLKKTYFAVHSKEMPESMIQDYFRKKTGTDVPGEVFGGSLQGRSLNILMANYRAFENGTATQEQRDEFLTAVAGYQAPHPVSGQVAKLPFYAINALAKQGFNLAAINDPTRAAELPSVAVPPVADPAAAPAPVDPATGQPDPEAGAADEQGAKDVSEVSTILSPIAKIMANPPVGPDGRIDPRAVVNQLTTTNFNLFDAADKLQGPVSRLRSAVSSIYGIGKVFDAPDVVQAEQLLKIIQPLLAEAVKQTQRDGLGEQLHIEEKYQNLESSFIREPENMQNAIIGIDRSFEIMANFYRQTLDQLGTIDQQKAKEFTNKIATINIVRRMLGAPRAVPGKDNDTINHNAAVIFWRDNLEVGDKLRLDDGRIIAIPRQPARPAKMELK